jgi:hypothetical protein
MGVWIWRLVFALCIFWTRSHFIPRPSWTMILLFYSFLRAGMIGASHPASFYWLRWCLTNFFAQAGLQPQSSRTLPLKYS